MPFQIYARVQELRREIAEIAAADKVKRLSGPEKVKHEKRIQRLEEIRGELSALIWEDGWGQNSCRLRRVANARPYLS
jgi:hypothetical protein